MPNSSFLFWIIDTISSCIGIVVSITLLTILTIKISKEKAFQFKPSFVIYIVYIGSLYYFINTLLISTILPIFKPIDQDYICHLIYYFAVPSVCITNFSVINLFIYRLQISFKDTNFPLSRCMNYGFRIIYATAWLLLSILGLLVIDITPHNIHNDLHITTCSMHENIEHQTHPILIKVLMACGVGTILIGYLVIWILFMIKLHKLLTQLNAKSDPKFIKLVQEQTLLVGIAVFSTLLFWILNIMYSFGQFLIIFDTIVNITVIFVSFSFNRYFFDHFGCHLLERFCCRKVYINKKSVDHLKVVTDSVFAPEIQCSVMTANTNTESTSSPQTLPGLHKSVTPFQMSQSFPF